MRFFSLMAGVFRHRPSINSMPFKPFHWRARGYVSPVVHSKADWEPFDWHKVPGVINPLVRDQGLESTCTLFAVAETVQAAHFLATGENVLLSPRDLAMNVSQPYGYYKGKMYGGDSYFEDAFSYMEHEGILLEKDCPYCDDLIKEAAFKENKIERIGRRIFIDSYEVIEDEESFFRALTTRPVVVDLFVNEDGSWDKYKEGIYNTDFSKPNSPHCVTIIGWGIDQETGEEFYRIKNSAGEWGQGGFAMVSKNTIERFISAGYPIILGGCLGEEKGGERNYARDGISFLLRSDCD
ncbi:hypothetical protein ACFX2C_028956 [Malus domestica]|uniref:P34 probable thiol protease-like isoform X1 n=1 Tax=Malus domestica TaxID=3750 RepID=UPI003975DD8E